MSKLEIRLFGQVEIFLTGALSQLRLASACQKLLAYLLLNPGKLCRREVLMDAFWPDNSPERARSCLNSALWRLRRELETFGTAGAIYLVTTDSGEIGFNWECEYWLDIQTFEQTLSSTLRKPVDRILPEEVTQLEQILGLYRGELLEGMYDDWTLIKRERLRILYVDGLAQLMNYYANCRAFEKSIEFARAILKEDPLREDIHRNMMRLYLSAGQRALAVQQYRICASILDRELAIPPMEETQQLYGQILNPSTAQPTLAVDAPSVHLDVEQQMQTALCNLDKAHSHLKQAAHLLARAMRLNIDV